MGGAVNQYIPSSPCLLPPGYHFGRGWVSWLSRLVHRIRTREAVLGGILPSSADLRRVGISCFAA